jgi:hypothetical protein
MTPPDPGFRADVWRSFGATPDEARELVSYAAGPLGAAAPSLAVPLPEAPSVAAWARYAEEARADGVEAVLRRVFVQMGFPVAAGTSGRADYLAATRRGARPPAGAPALSLAAPAGLRLLLHPTAAGRVPVVIAEAREDFESLVRAITCRNEPDPVPASMGACMVAGYNNWARVADLRAEWESTGAGGDWDAAFRALVPQRPLYQDRFLLLSSGPYSAVPAAAMGMPEDEWTSVSRLLRLEHECTHFFVREAFGSLRKSMLDELVADYMALREATGAFRADWFLLFVGLESHPPYRAGGRLQNYRGVPPLSDGAFLVLQDLLKCAVWALDAWGRAGRMEPLEKARTVTALTRVGLEGLASDAAAELLTRASGEAAGSIHAAGRSRDVREAVRSVRVP